VKVVKIALGAILTIILLIIIIFAVKFMVHRVVKHDTSKNLDFNKEKIYVNNIVDNKVKVINFKSKLLNKNMRIDVYLPKGYSNKIKYPVLYILPGGRGNEKSLIAGLNIDKTAESLIKANKIKPLIIVSPEIDNSLGLNSSANYRSITIDGNSIQIGRYEDYISKELVDYIDFKYSTIRSRKGRFISGISTGGYVALRTAFIHPYEYGKVEGISPDLAQQFSSKVITNLYFPDIKAKESGNILNLAKSCSFSDLDVYLDCENTDSLYKDCSKLYNILQKKGIKSEYHVNHGNHSNTYWKSNIDKYLLFFS
jgi:enterochelin esterase-like enzyme